MQNKVHYKYYLINAILVVLDMFAVNAAYFIALYARFYGYGNLSELFHSRLLTWMSFAPVYAIVCVAVFAYFRLYNGMWKYSGMRDFNRILFSAALTSTFHIVVTYFFMGGFPRTYYIMGTILQFFLLCSIRLGYRILLMEKAKFIRHTSPAENSMIIGHGSNARRIMEYLEGIGKTTFVLSALSMMKVE